MRLSFTKMQGAGNDFVVIDATQSPLQLHAEQIRHLADRRFGVGADQVLVVEKSDSDDADFVYRIFNADGHEVEQCGNGARCFARFVRDRGLSTADSIRVRTQSGIITPVIHSDGSVSVDMGAPRCQPSDVGFNVAGLPERQQGADRQWQLSPPGQPACWVSVVSMGNPHAVQWVDDLDHHPVEQVGRWLESHDRFEYRVNAGFVAQRSPTAIALRVFERGAGETLSCGTGACAAVVAGVRQGQLEADTPIEVQTRGGLLTIQWSKSREGHVMMTGPATPVFEGVIEL